jgi:hypothetical protein
MARLSETNLFEEMDQTRTGSLALRVAGILVKHL